MMLRLISLVPRDGGGDGLQVRAGEAAIVDGAFSNEESLRMCVRPSGGLGSGLRFRRGAT